MKRVKLSLAAAVGLLFVGASAPADPPDLSGLWSARLRFGPDIEGPLLILKEPGGWRAEIAGLAAPVRVEGKRLSFDLPDGRGRFSGSMEGREIRGHWIQERTATSGLEYATPLTLAPYGAARWQGEVRPLEDGFTLFLPMRREGTGYSTYLRNPERNQGRFIPVTRLELKASEARLFGRRNGQPERVIAIGSYDAEGHRMTFPLRGSSYDFAPDTAQSSPFHARGAAGGRYRYTPPLRIDDGWPVATLEQEGLSRTAIEKLVQSIIDAPEGVGSLQLHGLLIARHGRLVLEEYFHGYHRDRTHDVRSAGKSLTATLIGAAIQAGVSIREDTKVYQTMLGTPPADLDPRKRSMELRHLMTMTGGHFCDDNNPEAPGNEDLLGEQKDPDLYGYILSLPMDRTPGEKIVYCSADALLAGGLLRKAVNEPLTELFYRLVARPLKMGRYHLNLTPTGELYTAGGFHFRPRDFLKLAQLMLNEGEWQGKRVLAREWVRKAGSPMLNLSPVQQYAISGIRPNIRTRAARCERFLPPATGGKSSWPFPSLIWRSASPPEAMAILPA